ncbi:MAG: hypothetical protein AVDCRST_MAG41-4283 [uncultured Corynebacteriales bacterium]|uniref:NlpC/P60 domain-containing protein n=1 Tax=uncultured Mycobacteriales bacterium TaxID=581187 RepID=A0A6J4JWF8_9ACTN|nr:MAG: hypothetical protein AVDCRST_MAG41-4283 [uncultured Corynebacteriales bacterium]
MALPRHASRLLRSASVAGAAVLLIGVPAPGALAAPADPRPPAPTTAAQALQQLRALYKEFATASEEFHEAETVLVKRTAEAKVAAAKATAAARAEAGFRSKIKRLVDSQARSDPFGTFGAMLSSDSPGEFAAQASLIDVVTARRAAVLTAATQATATAAKARGDATSARDSARKLTAELAVKRTDISRRAARAAALFQRLTAAERAALTAAQTQRAAEERASRAADRARSTPQPEPEPEPGATSSTGGSAPTRTAPMPTAPRQSTPAPAPVAVPVSGRAGAAVAEARRQVGKPYVWGATGPGSFDCSGLTSWAWRAAGVSIPRTSRQQYAAGAKVSRSALRAGDLVYFGSPIYHVAIYVGGNTMISAPQPGDVVKFQSVDAFGDYAGATRPG